MKKFTKMQGLGNDYVYMDCTGEGQEINDPSSLAKFVSNRHFGIGSDGLILICNSKMADFKMRMFNYDGSEAEMCGNGIRCVGKFVYDKGLTNKTKITIETLAGMKKLILNVKEKQVESVKVDMGEPILSPENIPVIAETTPVKNLTIQALDREFECTCVSVGNPHAITIVEDLDAFEIEKYGPVIEVDKHFPNKINVEFIQIKDENTVKMRVWERGSGETMACGTGASAVAVACILNNYVNRNIEVQLLGGNLQIEWNAKDNHIYMTGPAVTVFEGEIEIERKGERKYDNHK